MGNLLRSAAIALLVATTCGFSAGRSLAADANTIRYGIDDEQNINRLPQFIAEKKGFFASEGVKVELVRLKSPFRTGPGQQATENLPTIKQAMASGAIDMARQQLPLLIHDDMAGAKYIGVAVATNNPVYFFTGQAGFGCMVFHICRSEGGTDIFSDFKKGQTVAVTEPWDGITIWTKELVSKHQRTTEDFIWKEIAGSNARADCYLSGKCAAAVLGLPEAFRAFRQFDEDVVYGLTNEVGPQLYQLDIANPDWAAAHRDLIVKYIRATTTAMRFIMDPKNHDETLNAIMDLTRQDRSRDILYWVSDPKNRVFQTSAPDMDNVKAVIQLLGKYGALERPLPSPEQFVDPSYARDAHLPDAVAK
jgi:ABC-type nitrate/sulfonate/bicarbonate transport system substrate-binding protein